MAVVEQVITLFLIILVGLVCRKKNYLSDEAIRGVTQITVNVALPALTVAKLQLDFSQEIFIGLALSFLAASALMILLLVLSQLLFLKKPTARRTVLTHLISFSNCGFMGYPLILSVNADYLIYAVAYNASFNFLCWTVGAALYAKPGSGSSNWKRAFLSPTVIASVLGIALFCLKIRLPSVVLSTLDTLGSLTTPLSMLLIGSRMSGLRLSDFRDADYHISAALRLVAAPLLSALLLWPFHLPQPVFVTVVLLMAMPAASTVSMQAEIFDGDRLFAARAVAYSTLLSLITVPIVSLLLV